MSKISSGTTTATGLVQTSDTTGNLELQTNNGTTAVTFDTNQNASFAGDVSINNGNYLSSQPTFRNLIINGDMRIAQRGTSVSGISSGGTYHTVDRFTTVIGSAGTWTQTQSTDVPTGQGFSTSLKMQCTTADASLASGAYNSIQHYIEAQNLQHLKYGTANAESLTLSFWVKSNKTGTYVAQFLQDDSTGTRTIVKSYTIDSADTWEKKTITIEGDTAGQINNDNGIGLQVRLVFAMGSDYTTGTLQTTWGPLVSANFAVGQTNLADSTSNYINLTGLQLEVGDTATPFEHRPYDVELARCERYYQKNYLMEDAPGVSTSGENTRYMHGSSDGSNNGAAGVFWRCRMRATPTVTWYTDGGTQGQWNYARSGASGTATFTAYRVGDTGANGFLGVGAAWVTCSLWGNWTADAEL